MQAPLTFKARCFGMCSLSTGLQSWVPNVGKALLLRGSWGLWVPSWWWITALGLGFQMRLCLRLSYPFWCRFFSFIWYVLSGGNLGFSCFPNYHFICYVSIFSSYGTGCNIRRGATPLRKELYIFLIISHLSLLVSFSPTLCKLFHVAGDMFIHSLEFISSQFRELTGMKKFPKASAWKKSRDGGPCMYTWTDDHDHWIDTVSGQVRVTYLTLYPGSNKWVFTWSLHIFSTLVWKARCYGKCAHN